MESALSAKVKVFYLFGMAAGLFFISDWRWFVLLATVQMVAWFVSGLGLKPVLKALNRLKWFILLIIISYLLIPPANSAPDYQIDFGLFTLSFYLTGLEHAGLMLSRVLLLVISSLWTRLSEPAGSFVIALKQLGIPQTVAIVIDAGLALTSGDSKGKDKQKGQGKGDGKGKGQGRLRKTQILFADIRQGKFGFVDDLIGGAMKKAGLYLTEHYPDMEEKIRHDAAIILAVVVAIMSLKLLQLLPGLPFAPGHKNLLVIPLLALAAMSTHGKYGGFAAGFAVGIVSFLMGYGKFGVFEVLQFALPGLMADIMLPLLMAGSGLWLLIKLAFMGALIGLTRFAANFMILMLAGSPELAWLVFAPMLISQVLFGSLSCLVCIYVVNKFRDNKILTI
jgi:hypothetical protein